MRKPVVAYSFGRGGGEVEFRIFPDGFRVFIPGFFSDDNVVSLHRERLADCLVIGIVNGFDVSMLHSISRAKLKQHNKSRAGSLFRHSTR
jgi:hypothetical protein